MLTTKKNKHLLCQLVYSLIGCVILSLLVIAYKVPFSAVIVLGILCVMGVWFVIRMYGYIKEEENTLETASIRMKEYMSGNEEVRIECDDEGTLYRFFHDVNSLVTRLSAHVDNEKKEKTFLKNSLSDVSHQLKTPLAALNVYNGILKDEAGDVPTFNEFIDLSEQELDRMEILIQSILKITQFDANIVELNPTNENLFDMMTYIKRRFNYRVKNENKRLFIQGDTGTDVICDRNLMIEAISNVVKNAFDHTQAGDTISITWRSFSSTVQIMIKDNGSGIPEEDLFHIFKRFYRSRFSKDTQGVGLGLSLTKAIIDAHEGTIEVDSIVGEGTQFTINC